MNTKNEPELPKITVDGFEVRNISSSNFRPTCTLRWLVTRIEMCDGPGGDLTLRKLQQLWTNRKGTEEWRDVPEVEVEAAK